MKKDYIVIILLLTLGTVSAGWLVHAQAQFLSTIGISKIAAITLEPALICIALLLGYKFLSIPHRVLSLILLSALYFVSLIATSSLYTKHLFTELTQQDINKIQAESSLKNEELVRKSISNLVNRGASSKSTLALIGKLESQQQITNQKSEVTELSAIVNIISTLFQVEDRKALIGFALLISFTTVSIPSFCFFSSGLLLNARQKPKDGEEGPSEIKDDTVVEESKEELPEEIGFESDPADITAIVEVEELIDEDELKTKLAESIVNGLDDNIKELEGSLSQEIISSLYSSADSIKKEILMKIKNNIINSVNTSVEPAAKDLGDRVAIKLRKNLKHYEK